MLIDKKVNLDFQNYRKNSALMLAIYGDHDALAEKLIDAGADLNIPLDSNTPLYLAAARENGELTKLLIDAGAETQNTFLKYMKFHSHKSNIFKIFLESGVVVTKEIKKTMTRVDKKIYREFLKR